MKEHSTKISILAAAARVVQRDGVGRLTIDAVAHEARLSKGGVLYHFASKDALVAAMLDRMLASFTADMARHAAADPEPRGRLTRAYVRATDYPNPEDAALTTGLLAVIANDPAQMAEKRTLFAEWQATLLADGLSPALATIIRLAADGLWMADLFGLAPPQGELRAQVLQRLLAMTQPEGE
ncbi:MAG: TetR/AcrR family transcriptional regulator [Ktedonobacterales bacterium]|nr:TetR/AcrR family transcriptional regulator [Ktedonobacterales bacterium]